MKPISVKDAKYIAIIQPRFERAIILAQLLLQAHRRPSHCRQLNLHHPNRLRSQARNWLEGLPVSTKNLIKNYLLHLRLWQRASKQTLTPLRAPSPARATSSSAFGGEERLGLPRLASSWGQRSPGQPHCPQRCPPPPRLGRWETARGQAGQYEGSRQAPCACYFPSPS